MSQRQLDLGKLNKFGQHPDDPVDVQCKLSGTNAIVSINLLHQREKREQITDKEWVILRAVNMHFIFFDEDQFDMVGEDELGFKFSQLFGCKRQ